MYYEHSSYPNMESGATLFIVAFILYLLIVILVYLAIDGWDQTVQNFAYTHTTYVRRLIRLAVHSHWITSDERRDRIFFIFSGSMYDAMRCKYALWGINSWHQHSPHANLASCIHTVIHSCVEKMYEKYDYTILLGGAAWATSPHINRMYRLAWKQLRLPSLSHIHSIFLFSFFLSFAPYLVIACTGTWIRTHSVVTNGFLYLKKKNFCTSACVCVCVNTKSMKP